MQFLEAPVFTTDVITFISFENVFPGVLPIVNPPVYSCKIDIFSGLDKSPDNIGGGTGGPTTFHSKCAQSC